MFQRSSNSVLEIVVKYMMTKVPLRKPAKNFISVG